MLTCDVVFWERRLGLAAPMSAAMAARSVRSAGLHRGFSMKSLWFGLCLASCALGVQAQTTVAFSFTGNAQTWVVPANVSQVTIEAWGAQGGSAADGDPNAGGAGGLGVMFQ